MHRPLKLVIFDLDGTLIDAYPAITRSFNYTMRQVGSPAQSPEVIRRAVGWGDLNLLKPFVAPQALNRALGIYRRHHQQALLKGSRVYAGSRTMLKQLRRRGLRLAVASNRPTRFSLLLLAHLRLRDYFDYVLCADKLRRGKPHPEILQRIMRHFSVKPKETRYVGDMVIDAQAGRRAGIRTIIVASGSSTRSELKRQKPDKIIHRIDELLPQIG